MDEQTPAPWHARWPVVLGIFALLALAALFGVWGTQTQIMGAVLAPGQLKVETNRQIVQHPDGGVVGAIHVKNGDAVAPGQVLISLDGADAATELDILTNEIAELTARSARLLAERDGLDGLGANPRPGDALFEMAFQTQARLFTSRLSNHRNEIDQLGEVALQTDTQVTGIAAELSAVESQIEIIADEVARQTELATKDLTTTRVLADVQTQEAELRGRAGALLAELGRLKSRIAQIKIERTRLSVARQETATAELADAALQLRDAQSRFAASERQMQRLEVKAPVAGIVLDMQVFAVQSVVAPGEPILYIVPQDQDLVVTARVSESDIDQLTFAQVVNLRFTALDTRFTPTVRGSVEKISADILMDEATGASFYEVEIRPEPEDLTLLGDQKIVPGMPVEAFIQTGERTPLEYLVRPLSDYFYRAFRSD